MNVLVTGGTGMVGRAIQDLRPKWHYIGTKEGNLSERDFSEIISRYPVTGVIHLAAKVGGVQSNMDNPALFFEQNTRINSNVLSVCASEPTIEKTVSLLSTCVYPNKKYVQYPLTEDQLHNGPPHFSNFGYAYAKRMIEVQSRAYNQQFSGSNLVCAIPNNIYGKHDNFDLENGHVIPAIIRKVHTAKMTGVPPVFWGNGTALREFTHARDIARALIKMIEGDCDFLLNIGNTEQVSIQTAVLKIAEVMNYTGEIKWDTDKPSGQYRKPSSNTKFMEANPDFKYTSFEEGIKEVCAWYEEVYPNVRGL